MAPFEPHFNTVFWPQKQTEYAIPSFHTSLNVLHQKLGQSRVENEEFLSFFKDRITIEELYAIKLSDQGKIKSKSTGFERDEGAGLKKCFTKLKETSANFAQHHKSTATALTDQVLKPLENFHENYKNTIASSKQNMDTLLKQFDSFVKEVEKSKNVYHKRCKEADRAEELALKNVTMAAATNHIPKTASGKYDGAEKNDKALDLNGSVKSMDSVQLGSVTLSQSEFDNLIRKMRAEIPIGEHRVPLLGRYQNTSSGENVAKWLQHNLPQCKDSPAMSDIVGQQLIQNYNVLRLIGQRGNKFVSSSSSFYQWRIIEDDNLSTADSNSLESLPLGDIIDKVTTTPSVTSNENGLEQHKKARREALKADEYYRTSIKRLDQMRMTIEEAMFSHLTEMEQIELQRISQLKQLISTFIVCLSSSIPKDKIEIEEMMVYQESLKPNQDIQYLVQQYAISSFAPKAILYNNYYHGSAHDQVFGVPLEELSKQDDTNVPQFISLILDAIQKGSKKLDSDTKSKLWSTLCPLERIHATCTELNISSGSLNVELFEKKDPILLVGVLRYFLLELPECLMSYEFYDLVDVIFAGGDDKYEEILVPTLSNLIATLPNSHFFTLKAILKSITSYLEEYSISENNIEFICQSMGSSILRPRIESYTSITNKLILKFFKQLLRFYDRIFSETTLKLHAESEKRRHSKPLVVTEGDIHTFPEIGNKSNKKKAENGSLKNSKRSSSLMSFMRPSVMNVFQKNPDQNQTSPKASSISSNRSVSLSFGSSITRGDSPPLSPKNQNSYDVPNDLPSLNTSAVPEVMFDIDDAMLSNDYVFGNHNRSDAILKDIDISNDYAVQNISKNGFKNEHNNNTRIMTPNIKEEVVDSSFFDDDDD